MKNILLCAGLTLAIHTFAFSQDSLNTASIQQQSEAMAFKMQRELSLSTKQTQQIIPILKTRLENVNSMKSDKSQSLAKINEQSKTLLAKILTKEQFAQYKTLQLETKKQKDDFVKKNPDYSFSDEDKAFDF
jgi:hypothetical protein